MKTFLSLITNGVKLFRKGANHLETHLAQDDCANASSGTCWRWFLLGLLTGLLFAVHSCGCVRAECLPAQNLEDVHAASCRVFAVDANGRGAIGTGTVCGLIKDRYYILTNWHVVEGYQNVTLQFFRDGRIVECKGKVAATWHNETAPYDFAIITVKYADLASYDPPFVPLAPRGAKPTVGGTILFSGCSEGRWASAWKGAVESYYGETAQFFPAPKGGQSGSAIVEKTDSGLAVTGILTWRVGDEKRLAEEQMRGGAIPICKLYDAFDGRRPTGTGDAVPEDAVWCLDEPEEIQPTTENTEPESAESELSVESPVEVMTEERVIHAEQDLPIQEPQTISSSLIPTDAARWDTKEYAIEDTEKFKAPVMASNEVIIEMIQFTSAACGPCQRAKPIVESFIRNGYRIHVISIDDEEGRAEAQRRQVTLVPTFITYRSRDGRQTWTEISRFSGIENLAERIKQAFSSGNSGGVGMSDIQEPVRSGNNDIAPLIREYENGFKLFPNLRGRDEETPDDESDRAPELGVLRGILPELDNLFVWIRGEIGKMIWKALKWAVLVISAFWFCQYWILLFLRKAFSTLSRIRIQAETAVTNAVKNIETKS